VGGERDDRPVARRVSSPQIVGRAEGLAALESALVCVEGGASAVVLVSGEAGVGKTRLVREAVGGAVESGAQALWGECVAVGNGELPYAPLVGALRPLSRSLRDADGVAVLGAAREELARLLPAFGRGGALAPATPASAGRLFELLLGVLERLAKRAPVVLVIEDVHWADVATEHLLGFLVRNLRSERLLLLMTWRSDEPDVRASLQRLLGELLRDERVEHVELARLTRAETALQVSGIVGAGADAAVVEWAHERGGGNPYFTEELVATRAAGLDGPLPDSLRAVLLARMAAVSRPARLILDVVAAAERAIEHDVLARAAGFDETTVAAALHELLEAHVLVRARDGSRYGFRHALAREAVYAELLAPERRALHARLGHAFEATVSASERGAGEWSALAHHWDAAGDARRALGAAIAAGGAAATVYAFADARRQLERARRLWREVATADRPEDVDEPELLRRLAEATRLGGQWDEAIPIAEAALAALPARVDRRRAARIELLLSVLHHERDQAVGHAQRALALLPDGPSIERAQALLRIAGAHVYGELPSVQRRRALEALEAAQAADAVAEVGQAHRLIGLALAYGGNPEAGLEHLREACRVALEHNRGEEHARAIDHLGDALRMLGRIEEALSVYHDAMEHVRRAGLVLSDGVWIEMNAAECEIRLGRWPEARARIACQRALRSEKADNRLAVLTVALLLAARQGEEIDSARQEREALALLDANVSRGAIVAAFSALAELALTRREPASAQALVDRMRQRIRLGGLLDWLMLLTIGLRAKADIAEQATTRDEPTLAAAHHAAALELVDEVQWYAFEEPIAEERAPPETLIQWMVADAELARLDGTPTPDLWHEIADRWDRLGQPYQGIYARLREAEARLATDERPASARALRAAHAAAVGLGALPLRGDLEALAKRARITLPDADAGPPAPGPPLDLTPRELTVLELLAAGGTNRQIAQQLYLSPRTVDVHVRHILAKLNAANRVEAAGIAHRLGIGSLP
jgi:DNA-binding CsgD family transcriptional regulator/tetratricopeptide (TPR) repeat protein